MTDRAYIVSRTLEDQIAIAENNDQNTLFVTLGALKEILAVLKEQEEVVRCKYCIHRGKAEKCILAAIAEEKGWPVFFFDNQGEWYCADGKKQVNKEEE